MNRITALEFIRDNSRLITSMLANPVKKSEQWEGYEPIYFEQRIGNNGTPFIIQDMGKNGWDIYFIIGGNDVGNSIIKFCEVTGTNKPVLIS